MPFSELSHDGVSLLLGHVSVHAGHGEVVLSHLLSQPLHLPLGVAEDDSLCDDQCVVQVAQGVELPVLKRRAVCERKETKKKKSKKERRQTETKEACMTGETRTNRMKWIDAKTGKEWRGNDEEHPRVREEMERERERERE